MSLTGMLFLLVFLPVSLAVYYLANDKAKESVLFVLSLIFYALGSVDYILFFILSILVTVCIGRAIDRTQNEKGRKALLVFGIVLNAGSLFYYKYFDFLLSSFGRLFSTEVTPKGLLLSLGISFYTFKAISYLSDVYGKKVVLEKNPVHDLFYLSFFAQIQSGPISRYSDSIRQKGPMPALFSDGVIRFMIGFCKKVLLANVLANITSEVFSFSFVHFSTSFAWLGALCYSLQLFFDFAGYSDMAIGISEMFGYSCMENFNYPYMTESVSKFWRRWHISLSQWFRDYIYIPMGGSRSGRAVKRVFNLLVVWVLTGIWHGAAWNFILWGFGYFVAILFERITGFPEKFRTKAGKVIWRILTLLFINFQWVVFRSDGIMNGLRFIKRMVLYSSDELTGLRTLFLLKDYAFFITAAVLFCFPVVPWLHKKLADKKCARTVFETAEYVLLFAAFLWAISFVVAGQNNPFAYANF